MSAKKTPSTKENIEREYTIPLREKSRVVPRYKKANKAVKTIKEFLARHMKVYDRDLRKIKIDKYLNEAVWSRGIKKPPSKIKVKAIKEPDTGIVRVELAEIPEKLKFKKLREEKIEKAGEEKAKKKKAEKPEEPGVETAEAEKTEEEKKEEKKEEAEKKAAIVEAGKQIEKAHAKQIKHEAKIKTKEPKRQRRVALQK